MSGIFSQYPSAGGSGGGGGLSSISFSIGTFDGGTLNQNGASVSSNSIFLQSAGPIFPGLVNSTSQTFSGLKTFSSPLGLASNGSFSLSSGQMVFDNPSQCITFQNSVASISLQIGQEEWVQVQNNSGASILNGRAVYITGAVAFQDTPTVGLAIANTASTSALLGVATHDIANGSIGYVTQRGKVHGIDTSAYNPGQRVWLSTASAGFFQITDPSPPNFSIFVGYVLDVGSTTGSLFLSGIRTSATVPFINPITTSGDLIVGSGSAAAIAVRIGRGLPGQIFTLATASIIQSWTTLNNVAGSASGAPYVVGALNGATASINGAVIGTSSLFLQSASVTSPGLVAVASTQSFTGLKSFTQVGINNTSGTAGLYVVSSGLATNSLTIQGLSGQTSLGLNLIDSAGNPKVVYDYNAGAFRLFVNAQEAAECNFDNRATVVTGATSTGSAARFNFICADQSAVAAGRGGGIAFGATVTGTTTVTEYGYVWATKNNGNAGDDDGTLHLASRNNATGKAQRGIDIDQLGNSTLFGNLQMAGALNGQLNISAGSSVATYTVVMPSSQGSGSFSLLSNDGAGNLSWLQAKAPTRQFPGNATWTAPVGCVAVKVTCVGGGGGGGGTASGATQGGAGGGGGGGGTVIGYFYGLSSAAVIVGAGGPGGTSGNNAGQAGSASTFSSISASGGSGGSGSISAVGPTAGGGGGGGGTGSGGDSVIPGSQGGTGIILSGTASVISGAGGGSMYGAGINGQTNNTAAGNAQTTGAGGGGSGGLQVNGGGAQVGGAGRVGTVIIEEFY